MLKEKMEKMEELKVKFEYAKGDARISSHEKIIAITPIGEFHIQRKKYLDCYGNPMYIINPIDCGYIGALYLGSKVRNKEMYQIQSYSIEDDFLSFYEYFERKFKNI